MFLINVFPSTCFTCIIYPALGPNTINLGFTINDSIFMLVGETFVYFMLYVYLNQVMPNEYGTHKSPLFFLDCITKPKKQTTNNLHEL